MRMALTLIFIFFTSYLKADVFTESCDSYCENEEYTVEKALLGIPDKIKIGNKKFKILQYPSLLRVKKSPCIPFGHYSSSIDHKPYDSNYSINSCMPCPPSIKISNKNNIGFCSIPSISLKIIYKESLNLKLWPKELIKFFNEWKLGRDMKGEHYELQNNSEIIIKNKELSPSAIGFSKTLDNNRKNIIAEILTFSTSLKESVFVMRVISPIEENTPMMYFGKIKFKTPQKETHQITKISDVIYFEMEGFMDVEFYQFVNDYIYKFQENFHKAFNLQNIENTRKDPSILYDLILTEKEIDLMNTYMEDIKQFNIQTRN